MAAISTGNTKTLSALTWGGKSDLVCINSRFVPPDEHILGNETVRHTQLLSYVPDFAAIYENKCSDILKCQLNALELKKTETKMDFLEIIIAFIESVLAWFS